MNKKNIIIIISTTIIFLLALAVFIYSKSLNSKENNKPISNTTTTSDKKGPVFYDIDGNKLSFDDFRGKPFVVLLWKSDNSKSYEILNLMTKYYEEYKDKISFLAINVNEPDLDLNLIEDVKAANFKIPIYFDTDLTINTEFSYEKLPDLLFLSSDRNIEKEFLEEVDEDAFSANLDLLINNY